jgi:hypothetical protein
MIILKEHRHLGEAEEIELYKSIDFNGLDQLVARQLGAGDPKFIIDSMPPYQGTFLLKVVSTARFNLGVFKNILSDFKITGTGKYNEKNNTLWLPLDFSYSFTSGGSNGNSIGTAWYEFGSRKWIYKPAS